MSSLLPVRTSTHHSHLLLLTRHFFLATPSAQSFYVPSLPGLTQDPNHPINIYAGHLLSDPSGSYVTPTKQVLAHLYFVLLKARRTADKPRLIIWFNVRWLEDPRNVADALQMILLGRPGMLFI